MWQYRFQTAPGNAQGPRDGRVAERHSDENSKIIPDSGMEFIACLMGNKLMNNEKARF